MIFTDYSLFTVVLIMFYLYNIIHSCICANYISFDQSALRTLILPHEGLGCLSLAYSLVHQCRGSQLWTALTRHMRGLPWTTGGTGHANGQAPLRPFSAIRFHISCVYQQLSRDYLEFIVYLEKVLILFTFSNVFPFYINAQYRTLSYTIVCLTLSVYCVLL